jgi:DNA-binding beta-propeller fold protein YncE
MPGRIDGALVQPRVIDALPDGALFVIDRSGRVQFFDATGRFLSKFDLTNAQKGYPTGSTVTPDGRIWIAETHAFRVGVYSRDGDELLSFGSPGQGDGQFVYVTDVAVSPSGEVFVCDFGGVDRIEVFDLKGKFLRSFGRTGSGPGEFRRPQSVVIASDGSLLVADACNNRIQKLSPDGKCLGTFGAAGSGPGQLRYPYGLAIGPDGLVYIVEYGNCRVQRMTQDGRFRGAWGSAGSGAGQFAQPWTAAFDRQGRLFVVDNGNSRVVVLDPAAVRWVGDTEEQASA